MSGEKIRKIKEKICYKMMEQGGYFTVEATLVLPLLLMVFLGCIQLFLLYFNYSAVQSTLTEGVVMTADTVKQEGKIEDGEYKIDGLRKRNRLYLLYPKYNKCAKKTEQYIKENSSKKIYAGEITSYKVSVANTKVSASCKIRARIYMPISSMFGGVYVEKTIKTKAKMENGCEQIRRWKQIENRT